MYCVICPMAMGEKIVKIRILRSILYFFTTVLVTVILFVTVFVQQMTQLLEQMDIRYHVHPTQQK